jgi:putative phosphonate metabolism protein
MTARYAVYFAPAEASLLWQAGCAWLGRDARSGVSQVQPRIDGISPERVQDLTASPRHYGLHATLKPPFRLAYDMTEPMLLAALRALAAECTPFALPGLSVDMLAGFIALRTAQHSDALQSLCDRCVVGLDRFRRPMDAAEAAKRRMAGLTADQEALLDRFGYPYVLAEWRFHITLTERVSENERELLLPGLARHFAAALAVPVHCDDVCLFVQEALGEPFVLRERIALGRPC